MKIEQVPGLMRLQHCAVDLNHRAGVMLHRFGIDDDYGIVLGYEPVEISAAFLGDRPKYVDAARATGYRFPYQLVIGGDRGPAEYDGVVWQCLPLDVYAPHARGASDDYFSIGLIGDFRHRPPSTAQLSSAADLVAMIIRAMAWDAFRSVKGHGEIDRAHNGSKAPGKRHACPGGMWRMDEFRDDVDGLVQQRAMDDLEAAGCLFTGP